MRTQLRTECRYNCAPVRGMQMQLRTGCRYNCAPARGMQVQLRTGCRCNCARDADTHAHWFACTGCRRKGAWNVDTIAHWFAGCWCNCTWDADATAHRMPGVRAAAPTSLQVGLAADCVICRWGEGWSGITQPYILAGATHSAIDPSISIWKTTSDPKRFVRTWQAHKKLKT